MAGMISRYPYLLPTLLVGVLWCVALVAAFQAPRLRKVAIVVVVALTPLGAAGVVRTHATHYKWLCITHHDDGCNGDGDSDPGVGSVDKWLADHFAD